MRYSVKVLLIWMAASQNEKEIDFYSNGVLEEDEVSSVCVCVCVCARACVCEWCRVCGQQACPSYHIWVFVHS